MPGVDQFGNDPFWGTKLIEKVAENVLSALTRIPKKRYSRRQPHKEIRLHVE